VRAYHTLNDAAYHFSALQRAENSSNLCGNRLSAAGGRAFQCSSASRKFLKRPSATPSARGERISVLFSEPKIPQIDQTTRKTFAAPDFSALQRAENSSNVLSVRKSITGSGISVLFSEPKIPQTLRNSRSVWRTSISVLFSEPKIPQTYLQSRTCALG